uniref:Pectinesterase n=1 Tax=Oryza nivara TaxID=4536 RepID=A0A0E0HAX7_ORYNI
MQVVLQNCLIQLQKPMGNQVAGGTGLHNRTVAPHPDLEKVNLTYMARPWKEYSMTIFVQNELGALVVGWLEWKEEERQEGQNDM